MNTDDRIRRILLRAAEDETYREQLLAARASVLALEDLTKAERAVLLAASDEQLRGMIAQAKRRPWRKLAIAGVAVTGMAFAFGVKTLQDTLVGSAGVRLEDHRKENAEALLVMLANEELSYFRRHGRYADLETLIEMLDLQQDLEMFAFQSRYEFLIELAPDGKAFTVIARDMTGRKPDMRFATDSSAAEESE